LAPDGYNALALLLFGGEMRLARFSAIWRVGVAVLSVWLGAPPTTRACDVLGPGVPCTCAIRRAHQHDLEAAHASILSLSLPPSIAAASSFARTATLATPNENGVVEISMANFTFVPDYLVVTPGTTIRWTNDDPVEHDTVNLEGFWNSGYVQPGESFEFTVPDDSFPFFNYECTLHGGMFGSIEVVAPEPATGLVVGVGVGVAIATPGRRTRALHPRNVLQLDR
jgi:plastocyanin